MLLVLITFSMMIWMNISSFNTVIVHLDDEVIKKVDLPMPVQTPAAKTSSGTANSNQLVVSSIPKPVKQDLAKRVSIENNVSQMPERNNLKKRAQFSPTRGVSANCNEEKSIELEFSPDKENFVFKWKKVSNATKYHLYISDDDEILIDEYETEKETTFVLKKSLNPLKTYKWKIIVTLENGQMVIGSSNKFTIKDFHTNQIKPEKKGKSDVRCSANG